METGKQIGRVRGRLREFSMQLAQRIKAAPLQPTAPLRLAVRIGGDAFLLDMTSAGEIVSTPDIARVPWTRPWFRGLANVRGRLVGVVDLMELSGRAALPPEQSRQLLVFDPALTVSAGVLITRAFGLRNTKELEALDPGMIPGQPWETARYRDLDGTLLTELDLVRLVKAEAFASIGV